MQAATGENEDVLAILAHLNVGGTGARSTEGGEEFGFLFIKVVGPDLKFLPLAAHVEDLASVRCDHGSFEIGRVNR